jgi:hypothetical protein
MDRASQKTSERERSGERNFRKREERSAEREIGERERSGERAISSVSEVCVAMRA